MALDIAALQAIYGTAENNGGNNMYSPKGSNAPGTYWEAIRDTGGTDTISASGLSKSVLISLKAADLEGHDAGGSPSYAFGVSNGLPYDQPLKRRRHDEGRTICQPSSAT